MKSSSFLLPPSSIAFIVLALSACALWAGQSAATTTEQEVSAPPERVGLWAGKALEVDQRAVEILETDDVSLMEYRLGDEPPVWFSRVAGFGKRAAFHPPELCYIGSHYEVLERGLVTVQVNGSSRQVMRLVIAQGKERFEAWYWFTANDRVTPNYYQQQLWLIADAMARKPMSGTLVRISTAVTDSEASHRRLLAFLTSFEA
ncbi:MAG: EpsI family protein [Candidatus Omnitrophota bacterium]|nr:EpsI family protein [Candidatus Omnitrophota bacterium]